jgi:hypothetical protein
MSEINAEMIEQWATNNKPRAKALGLRLIKFNKDPEGLLKEPSLGPLEDQATTWAVDNPFKAKLLLLKLLKVVTSNG